MIVDRRCLRRKQPGQQSFGVQKRVKMDIRYCQDGHIVEITDSSLYECISRKVDGSYNKKAFNQLSLTSRLGTSPSLTRRLIQDHHSTAPDKSSRQADQLSLTLGKISTTTRDVCIQIDDHRSRASDRSRSLKSRRR